MSKNVMLAVSVYAVLAAAYVGAQDFSNLVDVQTLSELSMDQLLSVKNQFELPIEEPQKDIVESREGDDNITLDVPIAMGLRRSKPKTLKRGGWEEEKTSKKGVGSIFQMSITTLAFLAFGGYLLCLIVQSLKDKGGYQKKVIVITPSSTAAPVTMAAFRRRRRRKPVRIRRPQRQKRDANDDNFEGPSVDMTPHIDTEKMFDALVSLSEAYTRYHTVDFRRFNQTIIHF